MTKRCGSPARGARAWNNEKGMKRTKINFSDNPDPVGKMKKNGMRPVPPGEVLNEEFLKPLGLTANALAKAIRVPPNRITAILKAERGITGGYGDPPGNVFQNIGGILDEPANELRPA
jgi:hypothetical protein